MEGAVGVQATADKVEEERREGLELRSIVRHPPKPPSRGVDFLSSEY
jgi:hypothetical protein